MSLDDADLHRIFRHDDPSIHLDGPPGYDAMAGFVRANAGMLGVTLGRRRADPTEERKAVRGSLLAAGWASATGWRRGGSGNVEIAALPAASLPIAAAALRSWGHAHVGTISLELPEVGHATLVPSDLDGLHDGVWPIEALFGEAASRNARLNALVADLRTIPGAAGIRVFGSVARGKVGPGDIDTVYDLHAGNGREVAACSSAMIRLAYGAYGFYDPFCLGGGKLTVRNDLATGWQAARNSRGILAAIAEASVPLLAMADLAEDVATLAALCGAPVAIDGPSPR